MKRPPQESPDALVREARVARTLHHLVFDGTYDSMRYLIDRDTIMTMELFQYPESFTKHAAAFLFSESESAAF